MGAPVPISSQLSQQQGLATSTGKSLSEIENVVRAQNARGALDTSTGAAYDQALASKQAEEKKLQGMQSMAQYDPWGFYRAGSAEQLASSSQTDPSNVYRSKLESMATGNFGIDDPSYKFRFEQGQQALERSQASKGLLGSGNAAQELVTYGQGMASTEYAAQWNRMLQGMQGVESQYNTQQSRLMELAGVNLDPLGVRKVEVGELSNLVSAQGQGLQAQSQAAQRGLEQGQWQDQLNMNQAYQQGLGTSMGYV